MASFPITQRCTSPAFLITRRLRRAVLQRDTGSGSKGACLEGGGAAGQQVLPSDRPLREV
jgi:hypothetical protein